METAEMMTSTPDVWFCWRASLHNMQLENLLCIALQFLLFTIWINLHQSQNKIIKYLSMMWDVYTLTNIWSNIPRVESKCFFRSHIRNSNTKYSLASSWRICSRLTTFGWSFSSLSNEISRTAVLGIPSSANSSRIFFKATSLLSFVLRPLYTTPYVPVEGKTCKSYKALLHIFT